MSRWYLILKEIDSLFIDQNRTPTSTILLICDLSNRNLTQEHWTMLGFSFGEIFLLLGATAAVIGWFMLFLLLFIIRKIQ